MSTQPINQREGAVLTEGAMRPRRDFRAMSAHAGLMRRAAVLIVAAACGCFALQGCTVGPDFVAPSPKVPPHWSKPPAAPPAEPSTDARPSADSSPAGAAASTVTEESAQRDWWRSFRDATLDSLIERSLDANLDLKVAMLRIEEARAQRAVTASQLWPNLAVGGSYDRERISETTPSGTLLTTAGNVHGPGGGLYVPNPYNQFQLDASASWEIDLFGRVRRSVEAAQAGVQVTIEDQNALRLALLADVAQNYMALRGAQSHLKVATQNLATLVELLQLTGERRAAGLTTHIDVNNARAQERATRAQIPAFELEITEYIHALGELLALEPEALRAELQSAAPLPPVPVDVPIGLPGEMARQRPDIRQAEANLHVATAQIGVAVANMFPRLTLSGLGGYQTDTASQLFDWMSRFGSFGPSLELPIFDRGRWSTIRVENVRAREAAVSYERTVLNALHEVQNAIAAYAADQQRRDYLRGAVAQSDEALQLTRLRYEGGVANFTDVLNAERLLQQNQLLQIDSATAVDTDLVQLYRALGGGWQATSAAADLQVPH